MIDRRKATWAWFLLPLLLTGCLGTPQQRRMEDDFEEMKRRLAALERSTAERNQESEVSGRLDTMGRQLADLQAALDTLRVDFQGASGRHEDLAHQLQGLRDELSLVRDDLGLRMTALEERLTALDERVARLEEAPAPPRGPAEPSRSEPRDLYEEGLRLIRQAGDFDGGVEVLENFLERFPGHELAVNAMYWIGEAYYGQKKYENAILQFQDVIQQHPDHSKTPAALLKQGLAFQALGDLDNARILLRKVVDEHPESEAATKARGILEEWTSS